LDIFEFYILSSINEKTNFKNDIMKISPNILKLHDQRNNKIHKEKKNIMKQNKLFMEKKREKNTSNYTFKILIFL